LEVHEMMPIQSAAANGLSAVRSSVAGIRKRTVRSTTAAEAVAELVRPQKPLDNHADASRMPIMNRSLSEIAEEAMALPQRDQLLLARTLLEKAEACGDVGAEAAWEDEIERRISRIDAGLARGRPFEEVLRSVDRRLGK
jgi:hypothetical protein